QLQVPMELPSVGMIKSFVAAGLGVSLISVSFARDQVLAGRVKLIPPKEKELWRELAIAYRRDRTLTRATSTFIATVRQLAAASKYGRLERAVLKSSSPRRRENSLTAVIVEKNRRVRVIRTKKQ